MPPGDRSSPRGWLNRRRQLAGRKRFDAGPSPDSPRDRGEPPRAVRGRRGLGLTHLESRSAWNANRLPHDLGHHRRIAEDPDGKDAASFSSDDASVVVAGDGDGELVETIRALRDDGFDGFFSLEPHLGDYNALGGFSGAELFTSAWKAFTDILRPKDRVRMSNAETRPPAVVRPGRGRSDRKHHSKVIGELADQIELVAVVDVHCRSGREAGRRARRRTFSTLADALAAVETDVVSVCTPTGTHGALAIEALRGGPSRDHREAGRDHGGEDRRDHCRPARGRNAGGGYQPAPVRPVDRDCGGGNPDRRAGAADLGHRLDRLVAGTELLRLRRLAGHLGT